MSRIRMVKASAILWIMITGFFSAHARQVTTIYGSTEVNEPVLLELLDSPAMERLKNIHQYGIIHYITKSPAYSRYEHSVGVFYLVRTFGGSVLEQIAALLHDASHTVFSHVGDHVFRHFAHKSSYQDERHIWYLEQTTVPDILKKYNSVSRILIIKMAYSVCWKMIYPTCALIALSMCCMAV